VQMVGVFKISFFAAAPFSNGYLNRRENGIFEHAAPPVTKENYR